MRAAVRWTLGIVVLMHGLLHLLGAAKGMGWSSVNELSEPIGDRLGVAWLVAALLLVLAGVLVVRAARGWWLVAGVAALVSQALIVTSWSDAKAGTIVNGILLLTAGCGLAANGPGGLRVDYRRRVAEVLAEPSSATAGVVTETDLVGLPAALAGYLRRCGVVGEAHVVDFRARIHGRIRAGATKPWMDFTGQQVNTFGTSTSRIFAMDATMFGLPVDVLHVFTGTSATMRVKLCSLVPIVNAAGPAMDRAETVTLFNDMCVLAPATILEAAITWQEIDPHRVLAAFTRGPHTVHAELRFSAENDLVDFVSDDRTRASRDGRDSNAQRWSTPVSRYRTLDGRRVVTYGEARWHAPEPEGDFSYLEFHLDEIAYNVSSPAAQTSVR